MRAVASTSSGAASTSALAYAGMRSSRRGVAGGVMLVAIGVLLVTGWWGQLVGGLQGAITDFIPVV